MHKRIEPMDAEIGNRIRVHREAARMSQTDLGLGVGVTFQQIQKYEKGTNRVSGSRLVKIARALKCQPTDFFGKPDSANGKQNAGRDVLDSMVQPGAMRMLQAFNRMPSKLRHAITDLMIELTEK